MRQQRNGQSPDRRDPAVNRFMAECGISEHAVSIRLIGVTEADVKKQLDRLRLAFGAGIQLTSPRQSGRGPEWIAYGTIIG
jgi:hypothetical protein